VARAHAESVGAGFAEMSATGVVAVVRKHSLHYHRSALLGDEVEIQTQIETGGGLRAVRQNRIVNATTGELLVDGETEWVWINPQTGRPKRPPQELLSRFGTDTVWRRRKRCRYVSGSPTAHREAETAKAHRG